MQTAELKFECIIDLERYLVAQKTKVNMTYHHFTPDLTHMYCHDFWKQYKMNSLEKLSFIALINRSSKQITSFIV